MNFEPLLKFGVEQGASAIHLQAGSSPQLRIGGLIRNVEGTPVEAGDLSGFIESIAPATAAAARQGAGVFSAQVGNVGRFRATVYRQLGGPGLVLRVIPPRIPTLEELNMPPGVRQVALAGRGLILVVGPSGSGKSTTLAAMVDLINGSAHQKIATIESPVEFLHANKRALVTQMEVGTDASSFDDGIRQAVELDADVIVAGDLDGPAAVRRALAVAESGKKVIAAMNGLFSIQVLGRLLAMVPQNERETAVGQLAAALEGVIALRLAATRDGKFRAAVEILRGGVNTSRSIQENRIKDLSFFIEGRQGGMQSLDQHLLELYQTGLISGTETMRLASNPEVVAVELRTKRQAAERPRAGRDELV